MHKQNIQGEFMMVNGKIHANIRMIIFALASVLPMAAHAIDFETNDPDLKATWNNTFKYSTAYRLQDANPALTNDPANFTFNQNSGDLNFKKKGMVSNRLDWLTELDVGTKNYGGRFSAAAWYDAVYNRGNHNDGTVLDSTALLSGNSANQFTSGTKNLHGNYSEVMDAFVYAKGDLGETPATARLGRHTLLYGETLFFGANGIANAQGPVDMVKMLTVPGWQFKEILRPVNQISGDVQLTSNVSVGAYYQLEWRPSLIPGVGSYLSDFNGAGAGVAGILTGPTSSAVGISDLNAKNSGQGGAQLKYTPAGSDVEYGLYAAQYNDKTPQLYVNVAANTLQQVYAEGIKTYGASASTVLLGANVAAEVSVRRNTPLNNDPVFAVGAATSSNPLFGVGNTAHANFSSIYVMPTNSFFQGGVWLAELAWNRTTSCTANCAVVDPNTTRDATAMRMIFEPAYYQVVNGMDITIPVGVGYNLNGRSSAVFKFNGGVEHGGDLSIGVNGTYQQVWKGGINYVHFMGAATPFLIRNPATGLPMESFGQSLADRDYISFNIKRSF
jgi:Protein of unknown function (DUF1302)